MYRNWTVPFYFLVLLFCASAFAQSEADTTQVRALTKRGLGFLNTYPDSLLWYSTKAMALAKSIDDQTGIAAAHSNIGNYEWMKGDYAKAIHNFDIALVIYIRIGNKPRAARILSNLGGVYTLLGDHTKAIDKFMESLKLAESVNAKDAMALGNNNLGMFHKLRHEYTKASEAFKKARNLAEEIQDYVMVAGISTNLGSIYQSLGDLDEAIKYHHKSLQIFDSLKNVRGQLACYANLGEVYWLQQRYWEATHYYNQALTSSREHGFPYYEIIALMGLGNVERENGNPLKSITLFKEAMQIAHSGKFRQEQVKLNKGLADSYRKLKRYDEALQFLRKYDALKDSIFNQESLTMVSNLSIVYELEKREAEIKLLTQDNKIATLTRNWTYGIAGSLILFSAIFALSLNQRKNKDRKLMEQQKQLYEAQQAIIQTELKNQSIKEEELRSELEFRSTALTTYTQNLVQKNEILSEIKNIIQDTVKKPDLDEEELKKLIHLIDYSFTLNKDWEGFNTYFEQVYPGFFKQLSENFPQLSVTELRLSALIRLSLSIKETATILSTSPGSVKVARHRLRKKLDLSTDDNLIGFIMSINSDT
jgi:tetratricopeptide (TPR) repeat protein/DNA-binding CsgD family transcriptional regulator